MAFPIKYIENNLIKNNNNEWWAFYRLEPYNYAYLSEKEKLQIFYKFSQLIGQQQRGCIHFLCLAVEESMRSAQELSKELPSGKLAEIAKKKLDRQTNVLIDGDLFEEPENEFDYPYFTGETQLDYNFFVGFKLIPFDTSSKLKETLSYWRDFLSSVNHSLMDDFVTVPIEEIERYSKLEELTFSRISAIFDFKKISPQDIGYICEHINGMQGTAFEDYFYPYQPEADENYRRVQMYDVLKLNAVEIEEKPLYIKISSEHGERYVSYLTYSDLSGENTFPGCEILYYQQSKFNYPVDVSIMCDLIGNRTALNELKNKKKTLADLDNHAALSGNDVDNRVYEAIEGASDLEAYLQETRDNMYLMSYLICISADSKDELDKRVNEVRDFYDDFNVRLIRSGGDMALNHEEFFPGSEIKSGIKRRVDCSFVSSLGFGAAQDIGEKSGIPIGYVVNSGRYFYLQPWLAAQGVEGSVTNSLSCAFLGSLGWGKSFDSNLLLIQAVLFGAQAVVIDPKSERSGWKKALPEIADEINIVNLTSEDKNRGLLDPFMLLSNVKDAENLALDVLTFLLGVSIRDSLKYPTLRRAIKNVGQQKKRGLFLVVDELRKENTEVSIALAEHIDGFVDTGLAQLLFSDGTIDNTIGLDKQLNIIQIADLVLPDKQADVEDYTPTEMLSVAIMIVISTFCLDFIHSDTKQFKIVDIDEAWALLNINQGKVLCNKLVREGRSMNSGCWFSTQNAKDINDEAIKNNIGMFFVFHSEDDKEITNALDLLGLDSDDVNNRHAISTLQKGECFFKDIYGRINRVKFEYLLPEFKHAFDTRPQKAVR